MGRHRYVAVCAVGLALFWGAAGAWADVVVVVSAHSPVTSLSKSQLADIFLGRLSRLPDGRTVVPIDQPEGSAARDEFYSGLMGRSAAQLKAYWSRIIFTGRGQPPRTVANGLAVRKLLAADPTAVGYLEAGLVDDSLRVLR